MLEKEQEAPDFPSIASLQRSLRQLHWEEAEATLGQEHPIALSQVLLVVSMVHSHGMCFVIMLILAPTTVLESHLNHVKIEIEN